MLRRKTSEKNPEDWFIFAAERLRAADVLWTHEGLTAAGIETLQEAVERYLKGYLIAKGWRLVKTHDLERLLKDASNIDSRFGSFDRLVVELTEDFFAQHYPGGDLSHAGSNYDFLRAKTSELLELIQNSLPQYFAKTS